MTKKDIEGLPTVVREKIYKFYAKRLANAKVEYEQASHAFVTSCDEKQRGLALTILGEINVLTAICKTFGEPGEDK